MKFYICPKCGNLSNSRKMEMGFSNCSCGYEKKIFNKITNKFEVIVYRTMYNYMEIPKYIYIELKKEKNDVIRLEQYNTLIYNQGD